MENSEKTTWKTKEGHREMLYMRLHVAMISNFQCMRIKFVFHNKFEEVCIWKHSY